MIVYHSKRSGIIQLAFGSGYDFPSRGAPVLR
jgi:hypothetical protein